MKSNILISFFTLLFLISCKNKPTNIVNKDEYYTCSMHPQIMESKPGLCPICHMDLIVVKRTTSAANEIELNDEQIRLGNIKTDTIRNGTISNNLILTATINNDETKVQSLNARVMGRIDRLYYKNLGAYVSKGDLLYEMYSEELNNAKQEYLIALEKQQTLGNSIIDFSRLIQSAKTKLLLWGLSERQINDLSKNKKISTTTSFYSNISGYIVELPIIEGQYVSEGNTIIKLADLSAVWVETQVYSSQLNSIDINGTARIQIPDFPGKTWQGKIEFSNPEINPDSRLNLIRISIPNNNIQLKPGMLAYVQMKSKALQTLTLPTNAVLQDGKMNIVWVQSGKKSFKMKMVETGIEGENNIQIKSGLTNGDIVVVNGAYLLNSEFIFKKGGNTMAGMDMSKY